ncbi:hypothetical protein L228DRAFT_285007 [Xylona heveae TC161]|uniref:Zn(2)-C6 fungal-type domain-containing protein n=1 Tax=Xylona heveae (strain CBS 132557 / TC161) TaxID=1328760 RepID=A0A165AD64_XYLHT|nr:hypothetical protein L228DRAFT_285007 [Xylona heveae TC161]KZF20282.1 hypothetical protein L228DRAFT_285007 [Xylona heveae TC161]
MIGKASPTLRNPRRVPKENRRRAYRACRLCRNRKSRCIPTDSGPCWRCRRRGAHCIYEDILQADEVSRASPSNATPVASPGSIGTASQGGSCRAQMNSTSTPLQSPERQQNPMPEPHSRLRAAGPTEAFYSATTSNELFLARIRESMFMGPSHHTYSEKSPTLNDHTVLQLDPSDRQLVSDALAQFPPRNISNFLLSIYFHYAEDSYFYFHQPAFRSRLDELYNSSAARAVTDPAFVCSVLMVFALGSQFTQFRSPNATATPEPGDFREDPGSIFYRRARMLLPAVISRCTIEAIQACTAMATYCLPSRPRDLGYFYLGLALKIAVASGLHRRANESGLSAPVLEIRNRLWWSIYSLERVLSIKMGRPESIREEDIDVPLPAPCSELDFPEAQSNIFHQMANVSLTRILNRIVRRVSYIFSSSAEVVKSETDKLKRDLKAWKRALPDFLRLQNGRPEQKGFRAVIHLYMNYYHAWIIMCRIPLLILVREKLKQSFQGSQSETNIDEQTQLLAQSCVKAANKMLSLFEILTECEQLARFSFTDFQGCSTSTIIILLHGILKRDSTYESKTEFAFNTLRFMSFGSETAEIGLQLVESFQRLADEAVERLDSISTAKSSDTNNVVGYEDWAQWLSKETRTISPGATESSAQSFPFSLDREMGKNSSSGDALTAGMPEDNIATARPLDTNFLLDQGATKQQIETSSTPRPENYQSEGSHRRDHELGSSNNFDEMTAQVPDHVEDFFMLGFTGLDLFNFSVHDDEMAGDWNGNLT